MTKKPTKYIYPKDFIRNVIINEIQDVVNNHKYLSFALIAIGIEFIGKCNLVNEKGWNNIKPKKAFNEGLKLLSKINDKYLNKDMNLRDNLRNGFAHTLIPKTEIALSEIKHGVEHLTKNKDGKTILVAECFFADFVKACHLILNKEFDNDDKMNKPMLKVNSAS